MSHLFCRNKKEPELENWLEFSLFGQLGILLSPSFQFMVRKREAVTIFCTPGVPSDGGMSDQTKWGGGRREATWKLASPSPHSLFHCLSHSFIHSVIHASSFSQTLSWKPPSCPSPCTHAVIDSVPSTQRSSGRM